MGFSVDGVVMYTAIVLPKRWNSISTVLTGKEGGGKVGKGKGGEKDRLVGESKAGKYALVPLEYKGMILNTAIGLPEDENRAEKVNEDEFARFSRREEGKFYMGGMSKGAGGMGHKCMRVA